ncbi:hypothetical protein SB861_28540 [Paraburkholderia sp. SIMBA_049]
MSRWNRRRGNGLNVHLAGSVGPPRYAPSTDGLALKGLKCTQAAS